MFRLKQIKISNFRCYESLTQEFSPNINIIIGDNAVGKTSLIESVYALGVTKSHKASSDLEMIRHNADFCFVKGVFEDDRAHDVCLSINANGKQLVKNGKKIKHISEYLGFFYVVMFCPEDLELVKGGPINRRKFLDVNIGQIDHIYLESLIKYKKILKQRNQILKDLGETQPKYNKDMLEILTKALIKEAKTIISIRKEFVLKLNNYFSKQVAAISGGNEQAYLKYLPNCEEKDLENKFFEREKLDLITKTTNCGPHRDDFEIIFNGKESAYASQGQQKTFVLALKLSLVDVIKEKSNRIIVILDDVFGELDVHRQKQLIKLLEMNYQIFITTTSIDSLDEDILKNSKIIKIDKDGD